MINIMFIAFSLWVSLWVSLAMAGLPPTAYQLATLNAHHNIAANDITVARFDSLLKQLSVGYHESQEKIANVSVVLLELMAKDGIKETLLNVMEGMNLANLYRYGTNYSYIDCCGAYSVLRNAGYTHNDAVACVFDYLSSTR